MRYLFSLDKQLIDFDRIEMDETLAFLLGDHGALTLRCGDKEKTLTLDRAENALYARGLRSFLRDHAPGYHFLDVQEGGVAHLPPPQARTARRAPTDRAEMIVRAAEALSMQDENLFRIYANERDWLGGQRESEDALICLDHLPNVEIYAYQVRTVRQIFYRYRGRVLLCDEVGLGKTIEAGMALTEYIMRGLVRRILILTPASLVDQWYYEMRTLFNQDFVRTDDPAFRELGTGAWEASNKVIASLAMARRKGTADLILNTSYDLVIVDEAHHLKNRNSVAWKFVNGLQKKYIFLLTATPVQNKLEELYNLITLIKPGQLRTYAHFRRNFVGDAQGLSVKNAGLLKRRLSDVMIRNSRSNVDAKLTNRYATTARLRLPAAAKALYDEISAYIKGKYEQKDGPLSRFVLKGLQEQMGSSFSGLCPMLEGLLPKVQDDERERLSDFLERARTLSAEADGVKLRRLREILASFDGQLLVFTKYRTTLECLMRDLQDGGFEYAVFHGGLTRKEKEAQVARFREGARVLLSTEAGGEGRNLQFCNGLVNYDLPWNPMAIEQRIGRIHRIGQTKDVYVFNLAAVDTLEYYILDMLDRKINLFELTIGEVDMILGDIEDESDFSDLLMDAWARGRDDDQVKLEMERLGDRLRENKAQYESVKQLEKQIFEEDA